MWMYQQASGCFKTTEWKFIHNSQWPKLFDIFCKIYFLDSILHRRSLGPSIVQINAAVQPLIDDVGATYVVQLGLTEVFDSFPCLQNVKPFSNVMRLDS